nr:MULTISPECIES: serine/threonine-protein kinase [Streptomyces]
MGQERWEERTVASGPLTASDPVRVGRYRLLARLGQGGMGRVYLARSPGGRAVAVKVVRDALLREPGFRRRFEREVAAARRVTGYFTAAVLDADPEGDPAWLATEYVPGLALQEAVARHGAWAEPAVRGLGAALAEALTAVHAAGLVHRDLKPSNVLLAPDGPRVIDFGIAVAVDDTKLTRTGVVAGSPGYLPPEQLVGQQVGPAGDVFALGALLAYAATGAGPFGGGPAHGVHYRVVHEAPDLAGLPDGLAELVARCLAKDPRRRPPVPELLAELGRWEAADGSPGTFAEGAWLPPAVAAEVEALRAAPLPEGPGAAGPAARAADAPPPTAVATAALAAPPRGPARRRRTALAAGAAVLTALAVVAGLLLAGELLDDDADGATADDDAARDGETPGGAARDLAVSELWTHEAELAGRPLTADGTVLMADGNGRPARAGRRHRRAPVDQRGAGRRAARSPRRGPGVGHRRGERHAARRRPRLRGAAVEPGRRGPHAGGDGAERHRPRRPDRGDRPGEHPV